MIKILGGNLSYNSVNNKKILAMLNDTEKKIKLSFSLVKEELEEHLDSINENTNEIQFNYDYIYELDKKLDKLNQRLDDMELLLMNAGFSFNVEQKFSENYSELPLFTELTINEREVFLMLYQINQSISYKEISIKLAISEDSVRSAVISLITKGVPIIKRYVKNRVLINIDREFKMKQKKQNFMEIDTEIEKKVVKV